LNLQPADYKSAALPLSYASSLAPGWRLRHRLSPAITHTRVGIDVKSSNIRKRRTRHPNVLFLCKRLFKAPSGNHVNRGVGYSRTT
jgi:hypothetical protein